LNLLHLADVLEKGSHSYLTLRYPAMERLGAASLPVYILTFMKYAGGLHLPFDLFLFKQCYCINSAGHSSTVKT